MGTRRDISERFWEKVAIDDGCWNWIGGKVKDGYGSIGDGNRGTMRAHRLSWVMANGPVSDNVKVLHKCDNRACVKPSHLFLGTQQDNITDMVGKVRHRGAPGIRNAKAKLTPDDVLTIRARRAAGDKVADIVKDYCVNQSSISAIATGRTWKGA